MDVGFDGKECVKLAVPKDEAESMTLLIEDGDGNIMHALSEDLASESRTTKGRPIAKLGMFKTNFVCFFAEQIKITRRRIALRRVIV